MPMINLEQLRARCALDFWQNTRNEDLRGGNARAMVRDLCALVLNNGLLAAIAFAKEKSSPNHCSGDEEMMLAIGKHLASKECGLLPFAVNSTDELVRSLTGHASSLLQQATTESLALLGYFKRFAPGKT